MPPLSNPAYEWRTRSALLAGDWTMVRWSIEQMPPNLRNQPAWVYWHARALKQAGDTATAAQEFTSIADQFNFYGQLACEELGQKITVPQRTVVTDAEIAQAQAVPGFALSQKFYAMNLRLEGNREWELAVAYHDGSAIDRRRAVRQSGSNCSIAPVNTRR